MFKFSANQIMKIYETLVPFLPSAWPKTIIHSKNFEESQKVLDMCEMGLFNCAKECINCQLHGDPYECFLHKVMKEFPETWLESVEQL